jgi:DNA-directed RNA polymerase subunit beta'
VGGTAMVSRQESELIAKTSGKVEFDEIQTVEYEDAEGKAIETVISRTGELRVVDPKSGKVLASNNIMYGSNIFVKDGQLVNRGEKLVEWDPFNAVIVSDKSGLVKFEGIVEGVTYREERDDQTGFAEKIIIESRQKRLVPTIKIVDKDGDELKSFTIPVGAYLSIDDGQDIKAGQRLVKIPRRMQKLQDITGGLPRVTELFEARNPSNPAVVSEIDGVVTLSEKAKRGNREVTVEAKDGQIRKYLVPLAKHILVQNGDFVRACTPLSDGVIAPRDILAIRGPFAVQQYLVNGVQEVYRSQGININDKHMEVIVRQMMRRFDISEPGDTTFLEGEPVERHEFLDANDALYDKKIITEAGDSNRLRAGQLATLRQVREENSFLKRNDRKLVEFRDAIPATSTPMLLGITKSSLGTESWISAASFQETTKVLSTAAIAAKKDYLMGLKENVIVGKRIPAGSGLKDFNNLIVTTKSAFEASKSKGLLDDLDMDYEEELVGDETEL